MIKILVKNVLEKISIANENLLEKINAVNKRTAVTGFSWGAGFNTSQVVNINRSGQIINIYLWLETTTNLGASWRTVLRGLPSTEIDTSAFTTTVTYDGKTIVLRMVNDTLEARSGSTASISFSGYANIMYIAGNNS